jgi:ATP-dependent Lon protease
LSNPPLHQLGIDSAALEKNDIHVHVSWRDSKDGPSGRGDVMALTSLLTGRTIRSDTAMTGEISLRSGPAGGAGSRKVVAAARSWA